MKTVKELAFQVHENAKAKGFWRVYESGDTMVPADPLARAGLLMLIVSEVAEAMESLRNNEPPIWQWQRPEGKIPPVRVTYDSPQWDPKVKPEGTLTEIADVVIRCFDFAQAHGWDLERAIIDKMEFNSTRPTKHGGKEF